VLQASACESLASLLDPKLEDPHHVQVALRDFQWQYDVQPWADPLGHHPAHGNARGGARGVDHRRFEGMVGEGSLAADDPHLDRGAEGQCSQPLFVLRNIPVLRLLGGRRIGIGEGP
jgi:hypothetical protein